MIIRLAALTLTVCIFAAAGCSQQAGQAGPVCVGGQCYMPDDVPASASVQPARTQVAERKVAHSYTDFAW